VQGVLGEDTRAVERRLGRRVGAPVDLEGVGPRLLQGNQLLLAAGRALDATVGAIKTSLRQGDIVTLVGFGSFYVGKRSPRAGRNPRTGDAIRIKGGKVPKFRAGKALKDALN